MKRVGSWILLESLGGGGNAEVWRAQGPEDEVVALKVLIRVRGDGYRRFRQEVGLLKNLGERTGVLPLLSDHLPERPNRDNPAWLAMPVAVGLQDKLGFDPSLDEVVGAVQGIAETLAELAEDGIAHRDVKPSNLYSYEGRPTIGDFGLAHFPGKEALTVEGKKLGPLYFIAPEMLSNATTADPHPADVYSLAKTLWVLATGQRFPPPGEQRRDTPGVLLSTYVQDVRANLLDALIEDSTRHTPELRPSMATAASDLKEWLRTAPMLDEPEDLSTLALRVTSVLDRERTEQEERNRPRGLAINLNENFFDRVSMVGAQLKEARLPVQRVASTILWDVFGKGRLPQHGSLVQLGSLMYRVELGPGRPHMLSGVGVELYSDGHLHLAAGHLIVPFGSVIGAHFNWIGTRDMPLTAHARQEHAMEALVSELLGSLKNATNEFVELFEASKSLDE